MIKNKIITICAVLLSLIQPLPSASNGITANNISSSKSTTIQSPEEGASSKEHNTAYDDESDVLDIKKTSIMYKKISQCINRQHRQLWQPTNHITAVQLRRKNNAHGVDTEPLKQRRKRIKQRRTAKMRAYHKAWIQIRHDRLCYYNVRWWRRVYMQLLMYAYKEDAKIPYHAIYLILSQTQESNRIDEINDGTWNIWSKLKYVNSRLTKRISAL